jgi:hypothetical protein
MIGTKADEYRELERESSNHLLEHDSQRTLGRYEEAASHALQAGKDRVRMGQLCFDAAEYPEAAADWLSAAACFLLAMARTQAGDILSVVHRLEADGKIPVDRPDLMAALRERERGLEELNHKVRQFPHSIDLEGHPVDVAPERQGGPS